MLDLFNVPLFKSQSKVISVFFFFQAGDGIRGRNVTGVQTCALPIYRVRQTPVSINFATFAGQGSIRSERSEERRVGKGVDLGGRRIIKKKKERAHRRRPQRVEEDYLVREENHQHHGR